jgi:hypothetical protein
VPYGACVSDLTTVSLTRDAWDWLLYAASLLAAITAILLFLPWALERRRRPEVRFLWRFSSNCDPKTMEDWPPDKVLDVNPGQRVLVEASIQNVGDLPGEATLLNFVVPDIVELVSRASPALKPTVSNNATAGLPPSYRVTYFAPGATPWAPANWFSTRYELAIPPITSLGEPLCLRLLFAVSDQRFNRTGKRWVPSVVQAIEPVAAHAGQRWPPVAPVRFGSWFSCIRRVRVEPSKHVLCTRGERQDVRDIRIAQPPSQQTT